MRARLVLSALLCLLCAPGPLTGQAGKRPAAKAPAKAPAKTPAKTPAKAAAKTPAEPATPAKTGAGVIAIEQPVEWNGSTRGIKVAGRSSPRVVGTATHPQGIAHVYLNGSRLALQPLPNGGVRFNGYLAVDSTTTTAEITAVTPDGERFSSKYAVGMVAAGPRETAPSPQEAFAQTTSGFKGKRWAVVVGVSKYRDPRITGLQYADADARAVYNFLRSERAGMGGFAPENIKLLLNQDATFRQIRVALFDFLKAATEEDVIYIYFAGHGSPDRDRPDNLYLIPYDADGDNLSGTGFPMEDLFTAVKRMYARQIVVITDACHSAGVGGQHTGTRALTMNQINRVFMEQMESSTGGLAVFTASEASQYSQEGAQWGGGHGVFTHYMLEALKGAADEDQNQIVDLGEMMEWVRTRVRRETRNAQIPTISQTSFDRGWPMAVVLPGTEIPQISDEEIRQHQQMTAVVSSAYDSPWIAPDSVVAVVGLSDSLRVRLDNESRDVLPAHLLTWTSSAPDVARVDGSGVVHAESPGVAQISAAGFNRRVNVIVRVYGRPSQIVFTPVDSAVTVVMGDSLRVGADLLIGPDTWLRGLVPALAPADSFVLHRQAPGRYTALREGQVTLTGSIAGVTRRWSVRVVPPRLKIPPQRGSLLLGDSMRLSALRTRPDGSVMGVAEGVVWRSSNPDVVAVDGGVARARGIGIARLSAGLGSSQDSVSVAVLGDLLVSTTGRGGNTIQTVSLTSGRLLPLAEGLKDAWSAALSPDGQQIVFASTRETRSPRIYLMNADGSNVRRLLPEQKGALGVRLLSSYEEHTPTWSHDGKRILFVSNSVGNYELFSVAPDGSDLLRMTNGPAVDWRVSAAPDLPRVAFERVVGAGDADLVIALPDGSESRVLTSFPGGSIKVREGKPKLLPGGTQMLYVRGGLNLDERAGETLSMMELTSGSTLRDLVQPLKDHELIYAVSPDGSRFAYHQHGRWKCSNTSVVVVDATGTILQSIHIGAGVDVRDLSWGATPTTHPQGDGK